MNHLYACLDATTLFQDHLSGLEELLKYSNVGSDHYSDVVVIATPYPTSKGKLEDKFAANIMMVRACV